MGKWKKRILIGLAALLLAGLAFGLAILSKLFGALTLAQVISIVLFVVALAWMSRLRAPRPAAAA